MSEPLARATILWHRTDSASGKEEAPWLLFRQRKDRTVAQQNLTNMSMPCHLPKGKVFIHRFAEDNLPKGSATHSLFYPLQISKTAENYLKNLITAKRCRPLSVGGPYRPTLDWAVKIEHWRDRIRVPINGSNLRRMLVDDAMLIHAHHPDEPITNVSYVFFRTENEAHRFRQELEKFLPEAWYVYEPQGEIHRVHVPSHGEMVGIAIPTGSAAQWVIEPFIPQVRVFEGLVCNTRKDLASSKALPHKLSSMAETFDPHRKARSHG